MKMQLDTALFRRGVRDVLRRYRAMRRTLDSSGGGEVLVSQRKKLPWEKRKPLHGKAVANMLAASGRDAFAYSASAAADASRIVAEAIRRSLETSWTRGQAGTSVVKEGLLKAAEGLAAWAAADVKAGGLGTNTEGTEKLKRRLVEQGKATAAYGAVPPLGIRTGRFVEGIRARWRRGRAGG